MAASSRKCEMCGEDFKPNLSIMDATHCDLPIHCNYCQVKIANSICIRRDAPEA